MRRVVPGSGDVGEFGKRGDDHDSCGNPPPRATADQVICGDGDDLFLGAYTLGELNAV